MIILAKSIRKRVKNWADGDLFDQSSDWKDKLLDHDFDLDFDVKNPFKKEEDKTVQTSVVVGIITFIFSFGLGLLAGHWINERAKDPDEILEAIKDAFKEEGEIEGSWIEMTKVPWKKYAYDTDVYYGGISRLEDGQLVQYEFIVDAYTGSLMDIYQV